MPSDQLKIETSQDPQTGIETVRLEGPMTLATLFEFQAALRDAATPKMLIDLTGVSYMDSAGLGALLSFHVSCSRHERMYAIAGASSRLRVMMEVAHVDQILNLRATPADALSSLVA